MNKVKEFTLVLDTNEVNTVIALLTEAPFKIAAPLLQKLENQLQGQVNQEGDAAEEVADKK